MGSAYPTTWSYELTLMLVVLTCVLVSVRTLSYARSIMCAVRHSGENHGALEWAKIYARQEWVILLGQLVSLFTSAWRFARPDGEWSRDETFALLRTVTSIIFAVAVYWNMSGYKRLRRRGDEQK